jgi:membrane protein
MRNRNRRRRPDRGAGALINIARRFVAENMLQTSAALAFTTLLSLVPAVALLLAVADVVPLLHRLLAGLASVVREVLLPSGNATAIGSSIGRFSQRAQQLTTVGIAFLGVTAFMLMHTIERTLNHVWRVEPRPFLKRVRLYVLAILVWPFVLAAVASVILFAVTASLGFFDESVAARRVILKGISLVLLGGFFSLLYFAVPNAPVARRGALLGGVFASLAFAGMQRIFEMFLVSSALFKSVYGAFAALPVFLVWLHLSWAVILLGALIAATVRPPSG